MKTSRIRARKARWSKRVTAQSSALDLDSGVFTWDDPSLIARSLARSAWRSSRRKGTPYQSAMSMLNFYVNRAGKNLSSGRKKILDAAKAELRHLFNR